MKNLVFVPLVGKPQFFPPMLLMAIIQSLDEDQLLSSSEN